MKKEYCEVTGFKPFKIIFETEEERGLICDTLVIALKYLNKERVPFARDLYDLITKE